MRAAWLLLAMAALLAAGCSESRSLSGIPTDASSRIPASPSDTSTSLVLQPIASTAASVESTTEESFPSAPGAADLIGVAAVDVVVGAAMELPEGMALIIETGCWHCDGSTEALYRVSKPAGGALEVVKLFEADRSAFANAYITSFAMRPDASEMVVAVCTRGYCGGLLFAEPSSQVTFYRSVDTGTSWSQLGASGEAKQVVAVTDAGIVVGPGPGPDYSKVWLVDGTPIRAPAGGENPIGLTPRNGEVLWWDGQTKRVLRADGSTVVTQPQSRYGPDVATNAGQPPLAFWADEAPRPDGGFGGYYLTVEALDGTDVGLRLGGNYAVPVQWLDERHILATVEIETTVYGRGAPPEGFRTGLMTPSVVDIYSGLVRPIAGIAGTEPFRGRNRVQAVYQLGTAGSCLPVHDRWKVTHGVLGCVAPRTLTPTGERRYGDAREWRGVWLADGRSGWVEASLLR